MANFNRERFQYPTQKCLGFAYIFNNVEFELPNLETREGSNKDATNLKKVLVDLGYDVFIYEDLSLSDCKVAVDDISKRDFTDRASLIMVFLSHGDGQHIFMRDGRYFIDDILQKFRGEVCPGLLEKPKIFIFQACRGRNVEIPCQRANKDSVVKTDSTTDVRSKCRNIVREDGVGIVTLPGGSDFLICNAASEGYVSHRDINQGSWYIQALVEVLKDHYRGEHPLDYDFVRLLTIVSRNVAERGDVESYTDSRRSHVDITGFWEAKQMPVFTSNLTKQFYLPQRSKISGIIRTSSRLPRNVTLEKVERNSRFQETNLRPANTKKLPLFQV